MKFEFEKWHGAQNDFIVGSVTETDFDFTKLTLKKIAPKLCDRRGLGIGADGILLLVLNTKLSQNEIKILIVNADGSVAKNCGNGLRCAYAYLLNKALKIPHVNLNTFFEIHFLVDEGIKAKILNFDDQYTEVLNNLSQQRITRVWSQIEYNLDEEQLSLAQKSLLEINNAINNEASPDLRDFLNKQEIFFESLGNSHLLIKSEETLDKQRISDFGNELLKILASFSVNVHFIFSDILEKKDFKKRPKNFKEDQIFESIQVYPFENGVGATMACGSGALASLNVIAKEGFIEEQWLRVLMPGGELFCRKEGGKIFLLGESEFVFNGEVEI